MSTLWNLLKLLLALIVILIGVAFLLPRTTKLARSIHISAPPAAIFNRVNTFQGFNEFSPWFERDPKAIRAAIEKLVGKSSMHILRESGGKFVYVNHEN